MAQGAEEKVHRRQAAHAGFVDEVAAQGLEDGRVLFLQGFHDGLVEDGPFWRIAVGRTGQEAVRQVTGCDDGDTPAQAGSGLDDEVP